MVDIDHMEDKPVKKSRGEKIFNASIIIFFAMAGFIFVFPFYNLLVLSFNDAYDAIRGGIYFWPRKWSLANYITVLSNPALGKSYIVTIARTVIGTVTSVLATGMVSYGLSKKQLMFRKLYLTLATITMFFSGGLVPDFILMRNLNLTNNFWVYIVPSLISAWNIMVMKSFFVSIPASLEEAAQMDGYNHLQIFFKVVIPICMPAFACISLFNGVAQWNAWFDAYIYITNPELFPLQTILVRIIKQSAAIQNLKAEFSKGVSGEQMTPEAIQVATMMIAIGPVILIYPFLQKYYVRGIALGSIKE